MKFDSGIFISPQDYDAKHSVSAGFTGLYDEKNLLKKLCDFYRTYIFAVQIIAILYDPKDSILICN
ncbi:hypothetical protein [Marinifilum flexuosum]|uniref:hypothetical protein n=1 Tax=Marinifilum flexuosum TaxID=1117708 RepID=UPI00248F9D5C|nr:hypothetical protein [Marinifilum flexuosum]